MELAGALRRTQKAAAVALALTTTLTLGPAQIAAASHRRPPAQSADSETARAPERELLDMTNQVRQSRHLRDLKFDSALARYATKHSRQMAGKGALFHTSNLAAPLRGTNWSIAGENVGVGYTVDGVQQAFMDSPPHRENILRTAFDHVAVGVYDDGQYVWVTVIFYGN